MKLLLDTCVSRLVCEELKSKGHDVLWAGDFDRDPGDEEILARAFNEVRVLVTLDKDFGELAIVQRKPHTGIVRLVNLSLKLQAKVCQQTLELHGSELQTGAIVTAESGRLRIRPPDL